MYYVILIAIFVVAIVAGIVTYKEDGGFMKAFLVSAVVAIVLRFAMKPALNIVMPESVREQNSRAAAHSARKDRDDAIMRMNQALKKNDLDSARFWNEKAREYDSRIQGK